MKKTFVLSLLLLAGTLSCAQQYIPFPAENVEWIVVYYHSHCEEAVDTSVYKYQIYGDTVLSGLTYKKLRVTTLNSGSSAPVIIGGVREEGKKIYYTRTENTHPLGPIFGNDEEELLYDFTAEAGDTVVHTSYGYPTSVIQQVDSVLIDGSYRKRFKVASSTGPISEYWIEGIGSIGLGLLAKLTPTPACGIHITRSVCFTENGNTLYRDADYLDCEATLSEYTPEWAGNISIFPNPASTGTVKINNIEPLAGIQAKVIDYTGRVLAKKELKQRDNTVKLPQTGFYLLILSDKQGRVVRVEKIAGG